MTSLTAADEPVVRVATDDSNRELLSIAADGDGTAAEVGSTGVPGIEPLVAVTQGGRTAFYLRCDEDRLAAIDAGPADGPGSNPGQADAVVDHEPSPTGLPGLPGVDGSVRQVLGGCGWRRPTNPADHEAAGGFAAPDPETVLQVGGELRGRGWGDRCQDESVLEAWKTVRDAADDGVVVVNGHGSRADGLLLTSAPFDVLDGAQSIARTAGADRIVVFASREDERVLDTVEAAIENYPGPDAPMHVVPGPDAYRAAEPTMALEAIEGNDRLEARLRPPGPERFGLDGRPTLVHTPRTVAHLAVALRAGSPADTRVLTVRGDVDSPATIELPETATLGAALDAVNIDGEFKAACVGGRFGGLTRSREVTVDPAALADADLGTEGTVQVIAGDHCVVEFVGRRAQFAADENCGRCVPCREGSAQLADLLRDVYDQEYDPDGIDELVGVMRDSSICRFGVEAGRPARTAIERFGGEFAAHADGRCPAGSCRDLLEAN